MIAGRNRLAGPGPAQCVDRPVWYDLDMGRGELTVHPVRGRVDHRDFWQLPWRIHAGDPCWVSPLRSAEDRRWSPRHNASLASRRVERILARRGGQAVGRVAVIHDPAFEARWSPGAGFFGFFECAPDGRRHLSTTDPDPAGVARALLQTAENTARGWGLRRLFGPVNLTTHEEVGFLIDGFDSRPMILSPWNPPEYPGRVEACGYRPALDLNAYEWRQGWTPSVGAAARQAAEALESDGRVVIRTSDPRRWDSEARLMLELYNDAFADNWGFVPLSWPEFRQRAGEFRPFFRPDLALFAELDGEPAGFALTLPDVNEALARIGGRLWPFGWLTLMRHVPRIDTARFILLGVRRSVTRRGIAFALAWRTMEAAEAAGIRRAELSLVMAPNDPMRRFIEEVYGWPVVKRYRLFEKELTA